MKRTYATQYPVTYFSVWDIEPNPICENLANECRHLSLLSDHETSSFQHYRPQCKFLGLNHGATALQRSAEYAVSLFERFFKGYTTDDAFSLISRLLLKTGLA